MGGVSATASERLTRQSGTNFYYAFRLLPAEKRRAIYALYAFCRLVDDCVDEDGGGGEEGLRRWLAELHRAYAGRPETELGRELAEAVARFPIPRSAFEDVVAGCRMDLTTRRYATFADLRVYCERVASAVGLASIEIFGYSEPRTREYAVELGLALQLTNILRDVAADAARDRVYLPLEDLARFGVPAEELLAAVSDPGALRGTGLDRLLAFEADRARHALAVDAEVGEGRVAPRGEVHPATGHDILERGPRDRKAHEGLRELLPQLGLGAPGVAAVDLLQPAPQTRFALATVLVHAVVDDAAEGVEGVDRPPLLGGQEAEGVIEVGAAPAREPLGGGRAHAAHRQAFQARPSLSTSECRGRRWKTSAPVASMRSRMDMPPSQVRRISKRSGWPTRSQSGRPRSKKARVRPMSSAMRLRKPSVTRAELRSNVPTPWRVMSSCGM